MFFKDKQLYISVDLPDSRKRFIITYENVYINPWNVNLASIRNVNVTYLFIYCNVEEDHRRLALLSPKNDLEKAADWLYDYEDKWMKNICNNQENKYNTDYFDDEDDDNEYEDDPDYIYANSRLSDTQAKLVVPENCTHSIDIGLNIISNINSSNNY
ncbi:hypothetical protein PPL_07456 [Heterostelium album PN500]|uniref:Uncharacterized protein n=1 Tax=Heterostelium pallidum (strain ATCC 26659 / Pp 5 / PN500) TaxID=670386 RepID=D3BG05_HETP5|nr:hypothetical protein PPL_07456 [Heterostelium album PN500]EFA79597.1 hypothetical protein PPL_07456 [Heterostelium album PN500]|eukprot:XP_020431718.1 hypothetical protein PPL_07456 [Heterostelium album PN500]